MNYNKWKKFKHIKLKPNNLDDRVKQNFANKINHLPKDVRAYSIAQLYKSPSGFIIKLTFFICYMMMKFLVIL